MQSRLRALIYMAFFELSGICYSNCEPSSTGAGWGVAVARKRPSCQAAALLPPPGLRCAGRLCAQGWGGSGPSSSGSRMSALSKASSRALQGRHVPHGASLLSAQLHVRCQGALTCTSRRRSRHVAKGGLPSLSRAAGKWEPGAPHGCHGAGRQVGAAAGVARGACRGKVGAHPSDHAPMRPQQASRVHTDPCGLHQQPAQRPAASQVIPSQAAERCRAEGGAHRHAPARPGPAPGASAGPAAASAA